MIFLFLLIIFLIPTTLIVMAETVSVYYDVTNNDTIKMIILFISFFLALTVSVFIHKGIKINTDLKSKYKTYQSYCKTFKPLLKKNANSTFAITKEQKNMLDILDYNKKLKDVQNKVKNPLYYWLTYYGFVSKKILKLKPIKL